MLIGIAIPLGVRDKAKYSSLDILLESSLSSTQDSQQLLPYHPETFASDERIDLAFEKLSASVSQIISNVNFFTLQKAVMDRATSPLMALMSHKILSIVKAAQSYEALSTSLSENFYWNFLDIRMMEAMAVASGIPAAQESITNFKSTFFNKSLKEVAPYFSVHKRDISNHTKMKEVFDKDLTLSELYKERFFIETELLETCESTCTICRIVIGSVKIDWLIHVDLAYKAYSMLNKKLPLLLSHSITHLSIPEVTRWEGLPILWRRQEEVGQTSLFEINQALNPHLLPKGLEWATLHSDNVDEIMKLYGSTHSFIHKNTIQWIFKHPDYKSEFVFGIRESSSKKLVWEIWCVPYHISIKGQLLPVVELQQQGIYYGSKQDELYNVMIREAMRCVSRFGISQSVLTLLTTKIIRPTMTLTLWVYNFSHPSYPLRNDYPKTAGLRRMTPKDVPRALALTNKYSSKFEIRQLFQTEKEFLHYFLCPSISDYMVTYVVEDPVNGNITDLFGFRLHTFTDVNNTMMKSATVSAIVNTKSPTRQLITDLLLCAKEEKVDLLCTQQYGLVGNNFENLLVHNYQYEYWHIFNYNYPEVDENNCCVFFSSLVMEVVLNEFSEPVITGTSEQSFIEDSERVMGQEREEDWKMIGKANIIACINNFIYI